MVASKDASPRGVASFLLLVLDGRTEAAFGELMRRKQSAEKHERTPRAVRRRRQIRQDLESLGLSAEFSEPAAARLEAMGLELGTDAYSAALGGAAAAFDVYREDCEELAGHSRDVDEIRNLMQGFAGELRKLEEGLRTVSAYVLRMHRKATGDRRGALH
jgi:hypothetical protein